MADPAPDLTALAESIADGGTPDWAAAEVSARSERERALIRRLRSVAGVAQLQVHSTTGSATDDFPSAPELPFEWGPLQVQELIGRGRFGDVYRARDRRLGRNVALKLLRDGRTTADDDVVEEGRLAARVRHPNVVTVFGAAHDRGRTGVWMELVDGRTLESELAQRGPFDAPSLVAVATQLADALAAVHDAGLIHRDVKATNVFREGEGRIVLGDFGTGRELSDGDPARTGLAGTPAYLAPEIFRREPATTVADVYSLGVLLFHLATGTFPVTGASVADIARAHRNGARQSLANRRPDLPDGLVGIVDRALDPHPSRRFANARELAAALHGLHTARRRHRTRRLVALASAAVVAIAAAAFWSGRLGHQPVGIATARSMVLVAPFVNDTGDPALDGTLDILLSRELQSAGLRVAPPGRLNDVLRLIRRGPDEALDVTTIRMAAIRDDGIALATFGRATRLGSGFEIALQVIEPTVGAGVTTLVERAPSRADLEGALRRLAITVAGGRGDRPAGDRQERWLTTGSLDAWMHYSRGTALRTEREGNTPLPSIEAAREAYRQAIASDPTFAMAHIMLAETLGPREAEERVRVATEALDLAESGIVTEVERRFIRAKHAQFMGNLETGDSERRRALFERAIRELEGLLEIEPDYVPALHNLSYLHQGLGQPVEAALYMDRIASLRPYSYVWQARAARAAYDAGGEEEAARIAARSADLLVPSDYEIDPQAVLFMRMVPAYVAWQNDDVEGALREAQAVALDPSVPESAHRTRAKAVSDIYLALGRLSDAGALAAEMRPRFAFQTRAVILYTKHDASGLRDLLESGAPEERALVPSLLIQAGMLEETREVVGDLGPGTVTISGGQSLYSGLLALAEGRTEDAIPLLAFANDQPLMGSAPWRASAALARAYQANGQPALAIEILESATRRSRAPLARTSVIRIWLTNLEALADAYREAGRIDEARAVESELRALLRVADEDHPLVVKLRAR